MADQLLRATSSVVLNIGEGANRYTPGQKRTSFSVARGECGELAVAIEVANTLGWFTDAEATELLELAARVGAMLTKLIQRHSAR